MFMMYMIVILVCTCYPVSSQFQDGIVFNNTGNNATSSSSPIVNVVDSHCLCVLIESCPPPSPTMDLRIANNDDVVVCPPGYILCCGKFPNPPDPVCGTRRIEPVPQVVIGQASFGAYPWHAAILVPNETFIGSGSLLDSVHVVTVAHKVSSYVKTPQSLQLRMGEWNAISTIETYKYVQLEAAKIIVHPKFNAKSLENDVAVIRLKSAVPIASYPNINTACKPTSAIAAGTKCYVSGWGKTSFGPKGSYQSIMREVDVPILDKADCEKRLRKTRLGSTYKFDSENFLCAGGEMGKDACTGDGGSPLVCQNAKKQWSVYGLVAWGIGCADSDVPGVYINVLNFLTWINSAISTPSA